MSLKRMSACAAALLGGTTACLNVALQWDSVFEKAEKFAKFAKRDILLEDCPLLYLRQRKKNLLRMNAYRSGGAPPTLSDLTEAYLTGGVGSQTAAPCWWSFGWKVRNCIAAYDMFAHLRFFTKEVDLIQDGDAVSHGCKDVPYDKWFASVRAQVEHTHGKENDRLVFCGKAPLSLWTYLGTVCRGKPVTVINAKGVDPTDLQAFHLWRKSDAPRVANFLAKDWVSDPNFGEGVVVVYLTVNKEWRLSNQHIKQIQKLFPGEDVRFMTLSYSGPSEPRLEVTGDVLTQLQEEVIEATRLLPTNNSSIRFALATSAVDGVAFALGRTFDNTAHFGQPIFLEYHDRAYEIVGSDSLSGL